MASPPQPPRAFWAYIATSWVLGWWLAYDGLHQRLFGDYVRINGQLGPWADLARAVGLDPAEMGLFFIMLGCSLIAAGFGLYLRRRWGYVVSLVACAIALLYLGPGTIFAIIGLSLLLLPSIRAYLAQPPAG